MVQTNCIEHIVRRCRECELYVQNTQHGLPKYTNTHTHKYYVVLQNSLKACYDLFLG